MSNSKILSNLTDNNLFELSIKSFDENKLKDIYKFKEDDNFQTIRNRIIYYLFKDLMEEKLSDNTKNMIIENYSNIFLNFLFNFSKNSIINTNIIKLSKEFIKENDPKSKLLHSYIEIKNEFDNLIIQEHKLDSNIVKRSLLELDKKIVNSFSSVQLYLSLAYNIDTLRDYISFNILKINYKDIENNKDKKNLLNSLYLELKTNKQKKIVTLQNLLSKINEQIQNQFSKITINTNKLKMSDLSKSVQIFLKYNHEINDLYFKRLNTNDSKLNIYLYEQINQRVNMLDEHLKSIKIKSPNGLKDDLKYLCYLYEMQIYHKIRINQLNNEIESNVDDLLSFINYLKKEEKRFNRYNIFSYEDLNYINLKNIINSNNSDILIHILTSYSFCSFEYDEKKLIGICELLIEKDINNYTLQVSETNINTKYPKSVHFKFEDIDSLIKFILSGFSKYDYLNIFSYKEN